MDTSVSLYRTNTRIRNPALHQLYAQNTPWQILGRIDNECILGIIELPRCHSARNRMQHCSGINEISKWNQRLRLDAMHVNAETSCDNTQSAPEQLSNDWCSQQSPHVHGD